LLLFFDGVALLVPAYMKERPEQIGPIMASPLREQGLLHILEPETLVDKPATEQLASAMTNIITSGVLDHLAREGTAFHELSYSRLGSYTETHLPWGVRGRTPGAAGGLYTAGVEALGLRVRSKAGIHIFHNYLPEAMPDRECLNDLVAVEREFRKPEPFASLEHHLHLLCMWTR
jgi:hypothetical protein